MNTVLYHHGIKGQKWGIRRYQNPDRAWTDTGKARYSDSTGESDSASGKTFGGTKKVVLGVDLQWHQKESSYWCCNRCGYRGRHSFDGLSRQEVRSQEHLRHWKYGVCRKGNLTGYP